jgi:hypothetical protein
VAAVPIASQNQIIKKKTIFENILHRRIFVSEKKRIIEVSELLQFPK